MTHCGTLLTVLKDGKPHDHRQLYRLGMVVHSRVADLRKQGHVIRCWRDGDTSYYQLESELTEREGESAGPSALWHQGAGRGPVGIAEEDGPCVSRPSRSVSSSTASGSGTQRAPTGTDGEGSRDAGHLSLGVPDPVFPLPGQLRLEVAA